jgi:hypothetical protein
MDPCNNSELTVLAQHRHFGKVTTATKRKRKKGMEQSRRVLGCDDVCCGFISVIDVKVRVRLHREVMELGL